MTKRPKKSIQPASKAKRTARPGRRTPRVRSERWLSYLLLGLIAALMLVTTASVSYWAGYEKGIAKSAGIYQNRLKRVDDDLGRMRQRLKEARANAAPGIPVTKSSLPSEIYDYTQAAGANATEEEPPKRPDIVKAERPKLAIIIDDVAFKQQLRKIAALPFVVTPSIFPPAANHPNTPGFASELKHYMVHLPMEALGYASPEEATLKVGDAAAVMEERLKTVRQWFPGARFVNNHTGSRFTSDFAAMQRFLPLAKKYGFTFIDSRTTPDTQAPKLSRTLHLNYVARDIFLDNRSDIDYIREQLQKAVKIAKKHGYAIAIGHPHKATFQALERSQDLLSGVDVVSVDTLYGQVFDK